MDKFLKRKLIVSQDSSTIYDTCVSASDHSSKQNHIDLKTYSTDLELQKIYHCVILMN
jgi:hypothetical protein